jgi:hypothetical protein
MGVFVVLFIAATAGSAWGRPLMATVTVVHALPGFTADVYVNGKLTLDGFKPETATDPLNLSPGRYELAIREVGATPTSKPALSGAVQLKGGQVLSIIAGLTLDGDPHLNIFPDDLSPVRPGHSRIVVRNVADVSPVDVLLNGDRLLRGVSNGQQKAVPIPAGKGSLEITGEGEDTALVNPTDVDLEEGAALILYVVGSRDQGTLDLMAQRLSDLHSSPPDVPAGDGGLATGWQPWPSWAIVLLLAGTVGLVTSGHALLRQQILTARRNERASRRG